MKLQIFHTVNEGLYIWNGRSGLLIDALHRGKDAGFSDTPFQYIHKIEKREGFFGHHNDLLFTHMHEDHYDSELADRFLRVNPESLIYGPGLDRSNVQPVVLKAGIGLIRIRNYTIYTFTTEHDGKTFAEYPHCSYLIQSGDQWVWISGDAVLSPALADRVKKACGDARVNAAFVMIYQIGNQSGKEFLKMLSPEHIYLYHLPYMEDDRSGYHRMAEGLAKRCGREGVPVTIPCSDSFIEQ